MKASSNRENNLRYIFLAVFVYFVLSIIFTYPLITHFNTAIPAGSINDPMIFYWNTWCFQSAFEAPAHNPMIAKQLFHPFEPQLSFHPYTIARNIIAMFLGIFLPLTASYNMVTLLMFAFSGLGAYLLTLRFVRSRYAAFLSGLIFSFCPFKLIRLEGHFNYIDSAFIPFFLIFLFKTFEERKLRNPLIAGFFLALIGYSSYYYLIFTFYFIVILLLSKLIPGIKSNISPSAIPESRSALLKRINYIIGVPIFLISFYIIFVDDIHLPFLNIKTLNGIFFITVVLFIFNFLQRNKVSWRNIWKGFISKFAALFEKKIVLRLVIMCIAFVIIFSPIIISIMTHSGDYWEELPRVTDWPHAYDLLKPSPLASSVRLLHPIPYHSIERVIPIGFVAFFLAVFAVFKFRKNSHVKLWASTAVIFTIFTLGPNLIIFERKLIELPFRLLNYIPFLRGTREPSRFIIMVMLAVGVLSAYTLEHILSKRREKSSSGKKSPAFIALIAIIPLLIAFEYITVPINIEEIKAPRFYYDISRDTENYSLLELPLWFNGKGSWIGDWVDTWGLSQAYQTVHGKSLISGYLAYAPKQMWEYYKDNRFIHDLALLQDDSAELKEKNEILYEKPIPPALDYIQLMNIRYFVIQKEHLSPKTRVAVIKYLKAALPGIKRVKKYKDLTIYKAPVYDRNYFLNENLISEDMKPALMQGFSEIVDNNGARSRRLIRKDSIIIFPVINLRERRIEIEYYARDIDGRKAPRLDFSINGNEISNSDITTETDPETSRIRITFTIPADYLKTGTNKLEIYNSSFSAKSSAVYIAKIIII